ncbi:hypothetical protein [Arsukibacterium sp.]|uniref:hypothetical protein n=1 Tax=Arsukibacterium sp. TaxID=1977258 RepID=UPI002FDACDC1
MPIRIGIPQAESDFRQQILTRIEQAYLKLGYSPEFLPLPAERRILLMKNGMLDADLFRICQLDEAYPSLIVVNYPLSYLELGAYSLNKAVLENWQQRPELTISHVHGFKMAEQQQFSGTRITVNNERQAFGLMLNGRVDIVLEDTQSVIELINQNPDAYISWQSVAVFEVCHVLQQSHRELADSVLQQLQQPH